MLVAVDDHAELGSPVADVVVADDVVAEGAEDAAEGVADDGAAEVADVHRLGDVGTREVDNVPARRCRRFDAQFLIKGGRVDGGFQPVGAEAEIDEPGTGDLRRIAEVGDAQIVDDLLGEFAWVGADLLRERHGAIGLVVAEFRVLRGADHHREGGRIVGEFGQSCGEPAAEFSKDVHAAMMTSRFVGVQAVGVQAVGAQALACPAGRADLHRLRGRRLSSAHSAAA